MPQSLHQPWIPGCWSIRRAVSPQRTRLQAQFRPRSARHASHWRMDDVPDLALAQRLEELGTRPAPFWSPGGPAVDEAESLDRRSQSNHRGIGHSSCGHSSCSIALLLLIAEEKPPWPRPVGLGPSLLRAEWLAGRREPSSGLLGATKRSSSTGGTSNLERWPPEILGEEADRADEAS